YETLPPFPPVPQVDTRPGWSWGSFILPFVEQDSLQRFGDIFNRRFGGGSNPALAEPYTKSILKLFRCPSDLGPDLNPARLDQAMANYRATTGPAGYPPPGFIIRDYDLGGVMYHNSKIGIKDITDGTSNTLIVGECLFDANPGVDKRAAIWAGMSGLRGGSLW